MGRGVRSTTLQPLEIRTVGQESSLHSQPLHPRQGCLCFSWLNKTWLRFWQTYIKFRLPLLKTGLCVRDLIQASEAQPSGRLTPALTLAQCYFLGLQGVGGRGGLMFAVISQHFPLPLSG